MTITDETIRAYAQAMTELGGSFPQCIVIYNDGSVDRGYYDQSLIRGGWHQSGDVIGLVKFNEKPNLGDTEGASEDEIIEMIIECFGQDISEDIANAICEHEESAEMTA